MRTGRMTVAVLLSMIFPLAAAAQQKAALSAKLEKELASSQAHYESETEPVGRAKALNKFGRAEIRAAREMAGAGNYDGALQYLKSYSDQAHAAHDALVKTGVNAEKHSNGFRQMQISVRENIRAIRDIAGQIPFQQRQPFDAVQQSLEDLDQQLILELFPRQPGHKVDKQNQVF